MTDDTLTQRPRPLYIDGDWHAGMGAQSIAVTDPARAAAFASVGTASADQVAAAAQAATDAFAGYRHSTGHERAGTLRGFAAGLRSREAALVELQMTNNGKPRAEAEIDLADAIGCFEYYAGLAETLDAPSSTETLSEPSVAGRRQRVPIGPVGLVVPWNFPLVTSAWKLAPALAAGCTVVLKVSEITPLAELVYGDIAGEMALAPGVLNIVCGHAEVGRAITGDARFRKLSFTGSNAVGSRVMQAAAEHCAPVSLELGGKSPIIVFADSDIALALDLVVQGIFMNCGQLCSATSRLLVEASCAEAFVARLVEQTEQLNVGAPADGDIDMGPLTSRPQYDKVCEVFERAAADRVTCLTGGHSLDERPGYFVAPTIYADVPTDHFLRREELFGPILIVDTFDTENDAVTGANDTAFGLAATVVSGDADRARRVAECIDAGHIWVNAPQLILPESSWGGLKASGIGRELGPAGLTAFQEEKFITSARLPE